MHFLHWMILQLLAYAPLWWAVFILVAALAAFLGQGPGTLAGHIVIAGIILALDTHAVEVAMSAPDWDGAPDFDVLFPIGVVLRVILVNSLLLPVSFGGLYCATRRSTQTDPKAMHDQITS